MFNNVIWQAILNWWTVLVLGSGVQGLFFSYVLFEYDIVSARWIYSVAAYVLGIFGFILVLGWFVNLAFAIMGHYQTKQQ